MSLRRSSRVGVAQTQNPSYHRFGKQSRQNKGGAAETSGLRIACATRVYLETVQTSSKPVSGASNFSIAQKYRERCLLL
jgi:hypothetical protein